jgi:hypothetical protein
MRKGRLVMRETIRILQRKCQAPSCRCCPSGGYCSFWHGLSLVPCARQHAHFVIPHGILRKLLRFILQCTRASFFVFGSQGGEARGRCIVNAFFIAEDLGHGLVAVGCDVQQLVHDEAGSQGQQAGRPRRDSLVLGLDQVGFGLDGLQLLLQRGLVLCRGSMGSWPRSWTQRDLLDVAKLDDQMAIFRLDDIVRRPAHCIWNAC